MKDGESFIVYLYIFFVLCLMVRTMVSIDIGFLNTFRTLEEIQLYRTRLGFPPVTK